MHAKRVNALAPGLANMIKLMASNACGLRSHMLPIFAAPKSQECSYIRDILQAFQQGHKVKQVIVRRIINPTFDRYRIVLSKGQCHSLSLFKNVLTLMEHIAERAIIQNHDFA